MFSFHKPKVYRSSTGCCICKAKSSSSRFTDSKKYEFDFIECFQLTTPRKGEICNACVLLVKRFKRLPPGSDRHWGHVVDARVGPGLKSMTKFKKRKEDVKESGKETEKTTKPAVIQTKTEKITISCVPERFCKIFKKTKKKPVDVVGGTNKVKKQQKKDMDSSGSDDESAPNSPMSSLSDGDSSLGVPEDAQKMANTKFKRKNYHPFKNKRKIEDMYLFDTQNWKQKNTCCGIVYENPLISAVIIDISLHEPCKEHVKRRMTAKKAENQDLENELNGNCNTDDLLIKLTDEQIQENIENASHTGFNKLTKMSDMFNTNTTAFKKHHLYSKRGNNVLIPTNGINDDNKKAVAANKTELLMPRRELADEDDNLHKIKEGNGGKVVKATEKLSGMKLKSLDFNVKNLVKICTEKSMTKDAVESGKTGKFMSDNSSDSGYEEAQEAQNLMLKPKTTLSSTTSTKPVVLPNGIKLHVQPQNLLLAANLAGISQAPVINQIVRFSPFFSFEHFSNLLSIFFRQLTESHPPQSFVYQIPFNPQLTAQQCTSHKQLHPRQSLR